MHFQIPSIYAPLAEWGFSDDRKRRRAFRYLICNLYRKRVWNPLINSWTRYARFDPRRHLISYNLHAAYSAIVLPMIVFFLLAARLANASSEPEWERACYLLAIAEVIFELTFNLPAIVLTRYLYLLTLRRSDLTQAAQRRVTVES